MNAVELADGTIIDVDSLLDLYQKNGKWKSNTDDDTIWTWSPEDVPLIRAALLKNSSIDTTRSFICEYCGAPNLRSK